MAKETDKTYSIGAIEKSFTVLEYISRHNSDVSAIEIHSQTGIPKASLHKILQTLKALGYIEQNPATTHYYPTMKLLQVAYPSINRHNFFETYYPYVMMYLRRFNLPCSLVTYSGFDPVVTYSSIGSGKVIIDKKRIIGCTLPLHASSSGRLLLANLSDDTAREILNNTALTPYTGATLCTAEEIIASLEPVRRNGYCRLDGEVYYGYSNLAFPLYDTEDALVGSYNMVVPFDQFETDFPESILQEIRDTFKKVKLSTII